MSLPNILTCSRIFFAALFMFVISSPGFWPKALALFIFTLASLTDYLDGRIARRNKQTSGFGALMDPVADKLLTLSAFIIFVEMHLIPAWMVVVVVTRDLMVTGLRLMMPQGDAHTQARSSGKQKTAIQLIAIIGVLIFLILRETSYWKPEWAHVAYGTIYFVMLFIVAITLWSGIRYLIKNSAALNESLS